MSVGSPASAVVQLTDNDTAGVTLDKTGLVVTEGGSATYTVALDSEPTADVTVTITGHAGTDLTLTPTTAMLTFTPSTWDRTQTVTVAAGDDGDALNDSALLAHRAVGATEYASVTASLSVTVTDDDTRATGAPTIIGAAEVGEELTANTSGIADADGLNNVSYAYQWVRVASGGQETDISGATSAVYTVIAVGDVGDAFKLRVTFTDDKGNPESLTSAPTAVATVAQVKVSFGAAAYGATEGGLAATVQIVLDKDPHRRVSIGLTAVPSGGAAPGDYTVAPTQIVFNAGETSKDVTVTAVDDDVDDDGESVELTFGMLPDGVSEGATTQSGGADNRQRRQGDRPLANLAGRHRGRQRALHGRAGLPADGRRCGDDHGTFGDRPRPEPHVLSFTTSDWNIEQSVTARADQDNDSDNDSATLTHAANGGGYADVTAVLAVTVADDDAKATGAPTIDGLPEVGETLTADTSQIMDADGLSSPAYRYQWVRVASGGAETDIPRATSATYRVVAADVGAALKVNAAFTDDKRNPESAESALTAVVTVAQVVASFGPGPYAAEEGRSVRVRVSLDKNPHRTVTIPLIAAPLGGADPGDYAAPTEVVFNAGETSKDVTVTAVDDSVDDDSESVELTFGRLPDGVSEGATTQAAVRITDNDGRGIDLSSTSLSVTEGGSATTYEVALGTQPTATVTVTISGHLGTGVSLDKAVLFFTPSDWNIPQTIRVSAGQDLDANNDSTTLTHTATGGDYTGVTAAVAVTVVDDDRRPPPPPPPPPITGGGGGGGGGGAPQNRAPEFMEGDRTTRSVAEHTPAGANIGDPVAASDFNRDTLTYSLRGVGSDLFDLDASSGQLLTKTALDYETEASYTVFVWVQDNKNAIGRPDTERDTVIRIELAVTNEDEAGAVALSLSEPDVDIPITASLTDPDGGLDRVVWSWAALCGPDRVDGHQRGGVGRLHAGRRRQGQLPTGDGLLHGRARAAQEGAGGDGRPCPVERRPSVQRSAEWRAGAERGGEHGRGRGRRRSGFGHGRRGRRGDLRARRRRRGLVRYRPGHGADQGRRRDDAGLRGGQECLRGDRHCHGLIRPKRDRRSDHRRDERELG